MKGSTERLSRHLMLRAMAVAVGTIAFGWPTSPAHAVPIYGGPTYDPATQTGYRFTMVLFAVGHVVGNGVAVGYVEKYEAGDYRGDYAMRWDASGTGAVELGYLGAADDGTVYSYAYAINAVGTVREVCVRPSPG